MKKIRFGARAAHFLFGGPTCFLLWLLLVAAPLGPLFAAPQPKLKIDSKPLKRTTGSMTSYAPVVSNVAPSVVSVYTKKMVREKGPLSDPFFRKFFGGGGSSGRRPVQSLGSGVIVSEDGYILTNSHVVQGAEEVTVATGDGQEFPAQIIGTDPPTDIAVIKIKGTNLPTATLADSENSKVGDIILALGNPFGVGQTVTSGIVSATERAGLGITDYEDFIQTDASINPGNSGGPLVDALGRVVGINTAIFSRTGGSMGIGFAVPINLARMVLGQLVAQGKVVRGFLGVAIQDLTPQLARAFKVAPGKGVLVTAVSAGSPAAKAGLQEGDVIVELDGRTVENSRDLRMRVSQMQPGKEIELTVLRDGKKKKFSASVAQLPVKQGEESEGEQPPGPTKIGAQLQDITPDLRRELDIQDNVNGVLVAAVEPLSPADKAGLEEGDVITSINRKNVSSAQEARSALLKATGDSILLRVWNKAGSRFVVIPLESKEKPPKE